MRYTNYNTIPYPFLHDGAMVISLRHSLESVYMDKEGGVCLTIKGKLSEDAVKDILQNINPNDLCEDEMSLDYNLDYSYSDDMQKTYVYSPDGIDYRNLVV